jgi:hypothetical protein
MKSRRELDMEMTIPRRVSTLQCLRDIKLVILSLAALEKYPNNPECQALANLGYKKVGIKVHSA